jgi:hypothetical protein
MSGSFAMHEHTEHFGWWLIFVFFFFAPSFRPFFFVRSKLRAFFYVPFMFLLGAPTVAPQKNQKKRKQNHTKEKKKRKK